MESTIIKNDLLEYIIDKEGIATITINMVKESTNLFSIDFIKCYIETAKKALKNPEVKGIIVTSGHKEFMAGADLKFLSNPPEDKNQVFQGMLEVHKGFREIEKGGKPFVAAIKAGSSVLPNVSFLSGYW